MVGVWGALELSKQFREMEVLLFFQSIKLRIVYGETLNYELSNRPAKLIMSKAEFLISPHQNLLHLKPFPFY